MRSQFDKFQQVGDWSSAARFFRAVLRHRESEREFYSQQQDANPVPVINSGAFLGIALARCGRQREADDALRKVLQTMEAHRDQITASAEASVAQLVAEGYRCLGAPLREKEALEVALGADPAREIVIAKLSTLQLPEGRGGLAYAAMDDLVRCFDEIFSDANEVRLRTAQDAFTQLAQLLDLEDAERSIVPLFSVLSQALLLRQRPDASVARQALDVLDQIILFAALRLPREHLDKALAVLSNLEDRLHAMVREATQAPCQLILMEAHHDQVNATLLISCRPRSTEGLEEIILRVPETRELQPVGGRTATLSVEWVPKDSSAYAAFNLGILGDWEASRRTAVGIEVELVRVQERQTLQRSMHVNFELFEEAYVVFPGGTIDPEYLNGKPLYGRQALVADLARSLAVPRQATLFYLFGARKVGKTSILRFVQARIRELNSGFLVVYSNLEGTWPSPTSLAHKLAHDLLEEVRETRTMTSDMLLSLGNSLPTDFPALGSWLGELKNVGGIGHVVLILDEFSGLFEKAPSQSVARDWLADLRKLWSIDHHVSLLIAGWRSKAEMQEHCYPSQFWADVNVRDVGFLDRRAVREAVMGPVKGTEVSLTPEAVQELFELTQGYRCIP